MKKPKREMPEGLVEAEKYLRGTNCQFLNMKARWKRKNREARLKNRIRVDLYRRMMEKYWKECTMDCLDALTMRKDMDGTYGQDIEGS